MKLRQGMVFLTLPLAGCGTHPLPEDVSGYNTYQIVQKIRCEMRDAAREVAISFLTDPENSSAAARKYGRQLEANPVLFEKGLKRKKFGSKIDLRIYKHENIAVAYDFYFDIQNTSDNSVSLDLLNVFSNGKRSGALGGGLKREMQGVRKFLYRDTIKELMEIDNKDCIQPESGKFSGAYPVVGKIGVSELLHTFDALNQLGGLSSSKEDKAPSISDNFNYTTTVSGNVNPKIELSALNSDLNITSAGMTNKFERKDNHKVVISLSQPVFVQEKIKTNVGEKTISVISEEETIERIDRQIDDSRYIDTQNILQNIERNTK